LIGTLVLFQTPVKPGIALIFSIALGLAFNNTVYLLSRLKRIQAEKKMTSLPLRRALLEEGNPCFSESFIMFVGFMIFLASDFRINQTFGAYMILSIFAGAIADLVFLPALLREFSTILWIGTKPSAAWLHMPMRLKPIQVRMKGLYVGVAALVACMILVFGTLQLHAQGQVTDEAKTILDKARAQLDSKDDQANVRLKIIEANGEVKTRDMTLSTLHEGDSFKAIIRIQAPADIKGTALLAEVNKGDETQWLYLPSSKQVRRVASAKKSTAVLGSELSPEDLNAEALKAAKATMVKKDDKAAVIEVIPTAGSSEYTRVVTTFELPRTLPIKTEYYTGAKLRKTVEFLNYKAVNGKVFRAQLVRVKNVEKNRGTDVELSNLKVNQNLAAKAFSQDALKDSW
jgi:outer membrane lipoprotein-sorting protein